MSTPVESPTATLAYLCCLLHSALLTQASRHEAFPMVAKLLTEFPAPGCEVWYMRFEVDQLKHLLALGTQNGRVLLWDLKAVSVSKNLSSIK